MAQTRMDPMKFEVISRLGSGAYAAVFKERYAPDGITYAVKVLSDIHANNPQTQAALQTAQREARVLMLCDHPNIIKYYATLQRDNGERMYVLELCDGGNLRTLLCRKKTFPTGAARYVAYEIALALYYLHEGEKRTQPHIADAPKKKITVLHRDIKPDNIVFTDKRHVKLVDFGTVSNIDDQIGGGSSSSQQQQQQSNSGMPMANTTFVGTIEYMSPEIHGGGAASAASDFWSLGIILFEMIAGYRPFSSPSQFETIEMIMNESPKFPPGFDPLAKDLVEKLLAKKPEDRLCGAAALQHQFFQPWVSILARENRLSSDWNSVNVANLWVRNSEWQKDEAVNECQCCMNTKFNLFNRKHHCRNCGLVVCGKCSENMVMIPDSTYQARERVCDECFRLLTIT